MLEKWNGQKTPKGDAKRWEKMMRQMGRMMCYSCSKRWWSTISQSNVWFSCGLFAVLSLIWGQFCTSVCLWPSISARAAQMASTATSLKSLFTYRNATGYLLKMLHAVISQPLTYLWERTKIPTNMPKHISFEHQFGRLTFDPIAMSGEKGERVAVRRAIQNAECSFIRNNLSKTKKVNRNITSHFTTEISLK